MSTVKWRVRAVRMLYGSSANGSPAVSYGPWSSQIYTARQPPVLRPARFEPSSRDACSDTVTDKTQADAAAAAHGLMPGFAFTGDTTLDGERAELYRVYVFTDRGLRQRRLPRLDRRLARVRAAHDRDAGAARLAQPGIEAARGQQVPAGSRR